MVAAGAPILVELLDRLAEVVERLVVGEVTGDEADALGQLAPDVLTERGTRVLLDRVVHDLREVLVRPVTPGEAHQGEPGREQPAVGEVVDRGHELLAGEVTRDAEDDQSAGAGDPGESAVPGIAQRVGRAHEAPFASSALVDSSSSPQEASNLSTPSTSSSSMTSW